MRLEVLPGVLFALLAATAALAQGKQEPNNDRLRRDQAEILRKAERLRDVMTRMLTRYEQEGRVEQTKLLKSGLEHLQSSSVLEDVAGIRNDLDALRNPITRLLPRYMNFRLVFENDINASSPKRPSLKSLALVYRVKVPD